MHGRQFSNLPLETDMWSGDTHKIVHGSTVREGQKSETTTVPIDHDMFIQWIYSSKSKGIMTLWDKMDKSQEHNVILKKQEKLQILAV